MRVADNELKLFIQLLQEVFGFIHAMMPEEDTGSVFAHTGSAERKTGSGVDFILAFSAADTPFRKKVLLPGLRRIGAKYPKGAVDTRIMAHGRALHTRIALDILAPTQVLSKWASAEGRDKWSQVNDWERTGPDYRWGIEWVCSDAFPLAIRVRIEHGVILTNMGLLDSTGTED